MKSISFACIVLSTLTPHISVLASSSTGNNNFIDHGPFPDDLNGSNFTYPWPVKLYKFRSQGLDLEMAFMDITPEDLLPKTHHHRPPKPINKDKLNSARRHDKSKDKQEHNHRTALLLHGRNFCAATWEETARALLSSIPTGGGGYNRMIIPDQINFCKSSKPSPKYQFTLHQLSLNTKSLLDSLNITTKTTTNLTIIGHSMGGMLATRFTLLYPTRVSKLVLINPIGLEDYLSQGVPYPSIDTTITTEQTTTYSSIRSYEQSTYYPDSPWTLTYDKWAVMLSNIYTRTQRTAYINGQARILDMVLTQPVIHELGQLKPKTLLMIGKKDTTAIGKQWSPPEVQEKLGRYDLLGKKAASMIPNSTLVEFEDLGHAPQIQDPERFHASLVGWLNE